MTAYRLLSVAVSLLALLLLASCGKDKNPIELPPPVAPCTTEGSLLTAYSFSSTATAQTPAGLLRNRYQYDLGRLLRMTDSPWHTTSFAHSADGLEITATQVSSSSDTTVTTYIFSAAGNLTRKTIVPLRNTGGARREDFEYDGAFHLLRRTTYEGPAFANQTDKLEYFWQGGNLTGSSFYIAAVGARQTTDYEYSTDTRGTSVSATLPEAELLFAMGKPYRTFPKNILRKTTYEYSSGGGGGRVVSDVVVDAGGRVLSYKSTAWSSATPGDSTRSSVEYGYECR